MDGGQRGCPNCGGELAAYRTETQPAGQREVRLHWMICAGCRHVMLHAWAFVSGDDEGDGAIVAERVFRSSESEESPESPSHPRRS